MYIERKRGEGGGGLGEGKVEAPLSGVSTPHVLKTRMRIARRTMRVMIVTALPA